MENKAANIVSAYSCPECKKISLKKSDIDKCIGNHKKDSEKQEKSALIEEFIKNNYTNYFKNQLMKTDSPIKSIFFNEFDSKLIDTASRFGITISNLKSRFKGRSGDDLSFDVSGYISRKNGWKISESVFLDAKILKKDFYKAVKENYYLSSLLQDTSFPVAFSDFARVIGLNTRCGSGGGSSFSYEVSININNEIFKELKNELDEYEILKEKRTAYLAEEKRLQTEYMTERFPYILLSDVTYSVYNDDFEKLCSESDEIKRKINVLKDMLGERKDQLLKMDRENMKRPNSSFEFDQEKFENISNYINGAKK